MASITAANIVFFVIVLQLQLFGVYSLGPYMSSCFYSRRSGEGQFTFLCSDNPIVDETSQFISADRWTCIGVNVLFHQVDHVDFMGCQYSTLPTGLLSKFPSLTSLYADSLGLTAFRVQDLPPNHDRLTTLVLHRNEIQQIDEGLFEALPSLKELELSVTKLEHLPSFAQLPKLEVLGFMYNTRVKHIPNDAFKGLINLKRLGLSGSGLTSVALQFTEGTALECLKMSHNNIRELRVGDFEQMKQLKELHLSSVGMQRIELGALSPLTGLEQLILTNNALEELDFDMFLPSMESLKTLHLAGNKLTELDDKFDQIFPKLDDLMISTNKFNCTYLKGFLRTLRLHPRAINGNPSILETPNIHGIGCEDVKAALEEPAEKVEEKEKIERGFESGYNVSIFILVLWISLTNLVICGVIVLVARKSLNFQSS